MLASVASQQKLCVFTVVAHNFLLFVGLRYWWHPLTPRNFRHGSFEGFQCVSIVNNDNALSFNFDLNTNVLNVSLKIGVVGHSPTMG